MKKITAAESHIEKAGSKTLKKRFEDKFKARLGQRCWNWNGARNVKGYGYIMVNSVTILAHRLAWYFYRGAIPDSLCVCHHCDNPACVHPDHLFLGTKKDNAQDAEQKGRLKHLLGSFHPNSKLNDLRVHEIRLRRAHGESGATLAREFKVTDACISSVVHRKTWRFTA